MTVKCKRCDKPATAARGLCWTHYARERRGIPVDGNRKRTVEEILSTYAVDLESGCWRWEGSHLPTGYGRVSLQGTCHYIHRLSYEHHHGPIAPGLTVDHICRNYEWVELEGKPMGYRDCFNPAHLRAVTNRENTLASMSTQAQAYRRRLAQLHRRPSPD